MSIVNVEKDGSIELPKTIMKQLDIGVGDKVVFEVENGKIILRKEDAIDIFNEISKRHSKTITMKELIRELTDRYSSDF